MSTDTTTYFQYRANELGKEIIGSIRTLLIENNLTELELPSDPDEGNVVSVLWSDDDGDFHDTPITKVSLDKDGISIDVVNDDSGCSYTLDETELWVNHFGWLCELRESIIETLKIKQQ